MLALQVCIGATNDLVDAPVDAGRKPGKPIPAGWISPRTATAVAFASGLAGLIVYATFGLVALAFALAMLGVGLAYDLRLKRAGLGWACFAVAFPLLPLSTWLIAAGTVPPRSSLLLPLAVVAGPALSIANGLVDLERDAAGGIPGPAVRLGHRRAVWVLAAMLALVYGAALLTIAFDGMAPLSVLAIVGAAGLAAFGLWRSAQRDPRSREVGWRVQVVALALVTLGWVAGVA
jgi:4-hydroxybenzoate polyprenyltransferase